MTIVSQILVRLVRVDSTDRVTQSHRRSPQRMCTGMCLSWFRCMSSTLQVLWCAVLSSTHTGWDRTTHQKIDRSPGKSHCLWLSHRIPQRMCSCRNLLSLRCTSYTEQALWCAVLSSTHTGWDRTTQQKTDRSAGTSPSPDPRGLRRSPQRMCKGRNVLPLPCRSSNPPNHVCARWSSTHTSRALFVRRLALPLRQN